MKKFLLFISFCLLCLTQMSAATETFDFTSNSYGLTTTNNNNYYDTKEKTLTNENVSIVISGKYRHWKGSSSQDLRLYTASPNSKLAVSVPTGYNITEIVVSGSSLTYLSTEDKAYSNGTWSGSSNSVTLTQSSKTVIVKSITVTYEPAAPAAPATQVATPTTTATDKMLYGAAYTISTTTEDATLYYTTDGTENWITAEGASANLYAPNAPTEVKSFTIKAYATKDLNGETVTSGRLEKTVTLYSNDVANPYKVVDVITVSDTGVKGTSYTSFSGKVKNGAEYAGRCNMTNNAINIKQDASGSGKGAGIFMTKSVGTVSKIIIDFENLKANKKCFVYGQNVPYVAYPDGTTAPETYYISTTTSNLGNLIQEISMKQTSGVVTIEEPGYNYILILANDVTRFNSITFEWEDAYAGGKDVTYEKQTGTTHLTAGKFITLVDTQNGKALSRNNAAEGTIAGAEATVENASENNNKCINLAKGQFSIDEFELVPAGDGFKLYGGGTITRRYIGCDATETGLTTTTDASKAAVVTFESDGTGIIVKFAENKFLVSDGTNFGIGAVSTESPASLASGATLVPAYVFVSPSKDSTGVEDIEMVETEAPAQYYNLNGVEVKADNLVPGIYIVRQGNKVSKQFIR